VGVGRPTAENRMTKLIIAVDSAAFDDRTRCLALISRQDETIRIYTLDPTFTMLKHDSIIPVPYLPQLLYIRLVPGRKVSILADLAKYLHSAAQSASRSESLSMSIHLPTCSHVRTTFMQHEACKLVPAAFLGCCRQ